MNRTQHQSRPDNARLEILRQELLAPALSIEGYAEMLNERIRDAGLKSDLQRVGEAAAQTRILIGEMMTMEAA